MKLYRQLAMGKPGIRGYMRMYLLAALMPVFLLLVLPANAQNVKLACWNILNYPNLSGPTADTTSRHPAYRTVLQYIDPDILVTEENTSTTSDTWFLDGVLNATAATYSKGTFINGYDTDNAIFFKTAKFSFVSNTAIQTDVRDINEFILVHTATGDTLRIYAVHLKASAGSPNDAQRALEVDSLRRVTNSLPNGKNFIVCGDFNIYGSYESAYQKLLLDNPTDDGNFIDPLTLTGTWNQPGFSIYHTQSTRTSSFGGGAGGGLNDRFDMILFSTAVMQGTAGVTYVPGSTIPEGNDGNHYNQSINVLPNTAAPVQVVSALYNASDHLPVTALLQFSSPSGVQEPGHSLRITAFPNPSHGTLQIRGNQPLHPARLVVTDLAGRILSAQDLSPGHAEVQIDLNAFAPGLYFLKITGENFHEVIPFVHE